MTKPMLVLIAAMCATGCAAAPTTAPTAGPSPVVSTVAPLPQGSAPVTLNPADFTKVIDNPYFPLLPGTKWVYREIDDQGATLRVDTTVTTETKLILGIEAVVVHDLVTEDGQPVEDTYDWYAQDRAGNVWYLGEDTKEYENGKVVSTKGTWLSGVDGAQPGIIMPAHPAPGMTYRQEYYAGQAEDGATITGIGGQATVPYKAFDNVLTTEEITPLEPDFRERKTYAPGVGPILTVTISGGTGRSELIEFTKP